MNTFDIGTIDGIDKIAVTTRELRAAGQRIKWRSPSWRLNRFGPMRIPSPHHGKGIYRAGIEELAKQQKKLPFGKKMKAQLRAGLTKEMERAAQRKKGVMTSHGIRVKYPPEPKILIPRRTAQMLDPTAGKRRARDLRAFAKVHEALERTKFHGAGSLHGHPEALAREWNLYSTLKGKGANRLKRSISSIRDPEYALLRKQLKKRFGPRAEQFMEPGAKIPKAMRKAMRHGNKPLGRIQQLSLMGKQNKALMGKANRRRKGFDQKMRRMDEALERQWDQGKFDMTRRQLNPSGAKYRKERAQKYGPLSMALHNLRERFKK